MRVVDECVGGAGEEDGAVLDEVGAVDDGEDLAGIVVGDEDADVLLLEEADEVLDVGDGEGVNVGEGLVKEEKGWLSDEGAGNLEATPFTTGEGGGFFVAKVSEMELVEKGESVGGGIGERF